MKKIIYLLILTLVLCNITLASTYSEINKVAKDLKGTTDIETINNVEDFVLNNFTYKFSYRRRSIYKIWKTKTLDCTGRALLSRKLLSKNKIKIRIVRGYVGNKTHYNIKHDWIEYRLNNTWISKEKQYFDRIRKTGYGIW